MYEVVLCSSVFIYLQRQGQTEKFVESHGADSGHSLT